MKRSNVISTRSEKKSPRNLIDCLLSLSRVKAYPSVSCCLAKSLAVKRWRTIRSFVMRNFPVNVISEDFPRCQRRNIKTLC